MLGSGQVLTPFVLHALSHVPEAERAPRRREIARAIGRLPIEGNEYPTYSIALSILALRRLRPGADVAALTRKLRERQLTEDLGWGEADPEYGGWDHGADLPKKPQCQRPDLSVTAFAVEALEGDLRAKRFAERCRAADGGFFFTPNAATQHQNKAGPGRSYATATCDALRILGADSRGRKWLEEHSSVEGPQGLDGPERWGEALFYYHSFVLAKIRPSRELAAALLARQNPDGSWRNPNGLMKEDDPLIATGLALMALCLCR